MGLPGFDSDVYGFDNFSDDGFDDGCDDGGCGSGCSDVDFDVIGDGGRVGDLYAFHDIGDSDAD